MNPKDDLTLTIRDDLKRFVRLAWELGWAVGNSVDGAHRSSIAGAIASRIGASAWLWRKGILSEETDDPKPNWTLIAHSPHFPATVPGEKSLVQYLRVTNEQPGNGSAAASRVYSTISKSERGKWHTITRVELRTSRLVDLLQFVKPASYEPFTDSERLFVNEVWDCIADNEATSEEGKSQKPAISGLAKRQREVLELLLCGQSAKEIAATLGISRHTVNDYSKALYRHFGVHGRAELAACFRDSSELIEALG